VAFFCLWRIKVKDNLVYKVGDVAAEAQKKIQDSFSDNNPVISISHDLRKNGFAADTMTVQNLKSNKRVLLVFHDSQPKSVDYEFGLISEDPKMDFKQLTLKELDKDQFVNWMMKDLV
jgi:hypothetical protein